MVSIGVVIAITLVSSIICFVMGWVCSALFFKKQINQNPPISKDQIKELYRQAGKTLSESQLLKIMNSLKKNG